MRHWDQVHSGSKETRQENQDVQRLKEGAPKGSEPAEQTKESKITV